MACTLPPLDEFLSHLDEVQNDETTRCGKIAYYEEYLQQTDYVAAKIAESLYSGVALTEDYTDILAKRTEARETLDTLTK